MKGPSLQNTIALSATLHATLLILSLFVLKHSQHIVLPSPYVVSLIGSGDAKSARGSESSRATVASPEDAGQKVMEKSPDEAKPKTLIDERISEIESKKRIERIVRLRNTIDLSGKRSSPAAGGQSQGTAAGQGSLLDTYYDKIIREIRKEWVFPDFGDKNLEAVIAVRIAKDGAIFIQGVEKPSGNALFDRSALRALSKASPVTPPPGEMEIGIRFFP